METIEDIVVEMRELAKEVRGYPLENSYELLIGLADRIEKSVINCNQLKMREALEMCVADYGSDEEARVAWRKAKAALSAPPRNCDLYLHDEALRIWSSLPESKENGCFDVWLYSEAKGEM